VELGIEIPTAEFATTANLIRVAEAAEQIGLGSLWSYERLFRPLIPVKQGGQMTVIPEGYASLFDPLEALAFAAAKTSRVKLGTSIIDALFHPPAVLGRRFATLDQLSGGRAIAGLGQGWMAEEFRHAGVPMKRRGAGFGEYIDVLRAIWGPDPVEFHGRFYEIPPSQINPKPVQPGGPPIIVAANTPDSLARTARQADGINPFYRSRDSFQQMLAGYRQLVTQAGRDPQKQMIIVRANVKLTDAPVEPRVSPLGGSVEQVLEELRWLRTLDVHTVFFAMGSQRVPVEKQLGYLEKLQQGLSAG
jgi:probable F420-dependent oxidoreductase